MKNLISKMNIRAKLMSAFIVITVLVLFIGVLIGKSTSTLNNGYYDVVVNDGFAQGDIGKTIQNFCLIDEYIHDYISYYDEERRDFCSTQLEFYQGEFKKTFETIKPTLKTQAELEAYAQAATAFETYFNSSANLLIIIIFSLT